MASLPAFLFDNYKRYKEDTNRIATWLVETAQKHGHHIQGQPSASSRLKGKARRQAREAAKASWGTGTGTRITITAREFTDLAESIANLKPPVKVPRFILSLICSAISLRKHCAKWFQKTEANPELANDNASHSHFIRVLERVLEILEPNLASQSTSSAQERMNSRKVDTGVESEIDKLTNIYHVLSIDENAFEDSAETPVTRNAAQKDPSRQTTPQSPRKTYEMEHTEEEFVFAFSCLLSDLNELRKFLRTLWFQYKDGSVDLITVSVTTNTAINLVRRAELDLYSTFPTIQSPFEVIQKLFLAAIEEDPDCMDDATEHSVSDADEGLFLFTILPLIKFCKMFRSGRVNISYPLDDHDLNPEHSTPKRADDENHLFQTLIEVFFLSQIEDSLVLDELTDGLSTMIYENKIQIWIVYATQIFLDIDKALQEDIGRGLSELQASGTHVASILKKYNSSLPCSCQQLPAFNMINGFIDCWILGDPLDQYKSTITSTPSPARQPFLLLKRHPLLCGLFQFQLHAHLQHYSINLANMSGPVLCAAYLYESCRQAGYLKQIWPDMELVMEIHTREKMFFGRVPQTPAEFQKCTRLMLGVSTASFSPTARSCSLKPDKQTEVFNSHFLSDERVL